MRLLLVLMLMLVSNFTEAKPLTTGVADVSIFQPREDSSVDVICRNGNRELVTLVDVISNLVCPSPHGSITTGMQLVIPRADGQFDVTCRDFSQVITTQEKILAGEICNPTVAPVLEAGEYYVIEGYQSYYDQTITVTTENDAMKSITIRISQLPIQADLVCRGNVCRGKWSYGGLVVVEVKSRNTYSYSQVDAEGNLMRTALFKKN